MPRHARSIALVLNPRTGLTSPQFHVKYNDSFETVQGQPDPLHGVWKHKYGFTKAPSGHHVDFKGTTTAPPRMDHRSNDTLQVLQQPNKGATTFAQDEEPPDILLQDNHEHYIDYANDYVKPMTEQALPAQPSL